MVKYWNVEELDRLIDGLSAEDKEQLTAKLFKKLSPEAKSRVMGLADSGLVVITGSFVSLNSEVAVNIQNSNNSAFDPEALVRALIEYRRKSSS